MKKYKVIPCTGQGQGSCKRCEDNGIWNRTWMCFLYRIEGLEGCYCEECVKEILGDREMKGTIDYQKYINALRKCAKEHDSDITFTGHIIVSDLCRDTANLLEELELKTEHYKADTGETE